MPEDDIECESFTDISIDSLSVHKNKYYLQVYLDNCAYRIANKQITDYLNDIAIVTVKDVDYRCIIHNISKSEAISLLQNPVLEDRGYI